MNKAYINAYELFCDAGDTKELMGAIYNKKTAITTTNSYLKDGTCGLGMMNYAGSFFELLGSVAQKVLDSSDLDNFNDTLLILGSSVGGMQECENIFYKDKNYKNIDPDRYSMNVLSDYLDDRFGFLDKRAISTACTSSANALLLAKRLMEVGAYKNILVVGADGLCYSTVLGFSSLGVLSDAPCRPFDKDRNGMNVAEGIAMLLIQDTKQDNSIEIKGVGASSDAYHMTNPDPEAKGAIKSMQDALVDANLKPSDIDYINAHGTATLANDKVEALGIKKLFGKNVATSSTKAITGHTLGAAGAMEAVISCEIIKHSLIPAQTGLENIEDDKLNIPFENIDAKIKNVLSNSFAFGGNNASIVFGVPQ